MVSSTDFQASAEECMECEELIGCGFSLCAAPSSGSCPRFWKGEDKSNGMSEESVRAKSIFKLGAKYKTTTLFIQDIPWRIHKYQEISGDLSEGEISGSTTDMVKAWRGFRHDGAW